MNPILCLCLSNRHRDTPRLNTPTDLHPCDESESLCLPPPVCSWNGSVVLAPHITSQAKAITDLLFLCVVGTGGAKVTKLLPTSNQWVKWQVSQKQLYKLLLLLTVLDVNISVQNIFSLLFFGVVFYLHCRQFAVFRHPTKPALSYNSDISFSIWVYFGSGLSLGELWVHAAYFRHWVYVGFPQANFKQDSNI